MTEKTCKVEVKPDYLEKVSHTSPDKALSEIIWNSLDADANSVDIIFKHDDMGTSEIIIRDDGTGFSIEQAEHLFTSLGGSWKSTREKTEEGRLLHGAEGQGRFKAFSLGRCVEWKVWNKTRENEAQKPFRIVATADHLERFTIEEMALEENPRQGVIVTISEPHKQFSIFEADNAVEKLLPIFALYLSNYKHISINVGGKRLNPLDAIKRMESITLDPASYNGTNYAVELEIVEWIEGGDKELWLCTKNGFPLEKYPKQIRGIGGFGFNGYLKSELINVLSSDGTLGLGELNTHLRDVMDKAINEIRKYFSGRILEESQEKVLQWKKEKIYPFKEESTSPIEVAERQVFDVVATKVAESLPSFEESDKKSKAFQLRMLRHAVERGPEELQAVITEVLNLPKKQLDQLSEILKDVSLTGVISASKLVTDRLKFLAALEHLLFDEDHKKTLKERSQLHKMIAENTWLFGQEFSVSVNDRSLTEVLKKHIEKSGKSTPVDEPVLRIDGSVGIVDLMLSRSMPCNREDEIEHLVVELKAPKVKIGEKECSQIESYAFAVIEDERFASLSAKWDFWIISNELDAYALRKTTQDGRPKGVLHRETEKANVTIWVKTWSQIIRENKHRLEFVRDKLNYEIDRNDALQHLRENYSQFIKGVVVENEDVQESA